MKGKCAPTYVEEIKVVALSDIKPYTIVISFILVG